MKKILPYILICCILLCGCNQVNQDKPLPTQAPTEESVFDEAITIQPSENPTESNGYTQQPMFAVSLPVSADPIREESVFTYQDIHLFCQDQSVADRIIIDYLNRQDGHRNKAESGSNSSYQILYRPMRIDSGVLSLYGESVAHQGRNHPIIECQALNYNMITGEVLTLGSILYDASAREKLQDALLYSAESAAEVMTLYNDYPQIIADRFSRNSSFDEDWFFTSTGLAFFFEPYEIAPYTSGIVILEIPYEKLPGIIADGFFLGEEDFYEGNLCADSVNDINLDAYTQMVEVYINGYSEGVILYSDGLLRDIRIETVPENEDASGSTIFAANTLSPGDGIILMYDPLVPNPILKITYRVAQSVTTKELYFDSNGAFVLT